MIVTIGLVVAAIGPVLLIGGNLLMGLGKVISFASTLSTTIAGAGGLSAAFTLLTGPIGITIAAIVAIGLAIITLYRENEEFREKIKILWDSIQGLISAVIDKIKEIAEKGLNFIKDFWDKHGEAIEKIADVAWNAISNIISVIVDVITKVIQTFTALISGDWEGFTEGLKDTWSLLWETIESIVTGAWNILSTAFSGLWDSIKGWFDNLICPSQAKL